VTRKPADLQNGGDDIPPKPVIIVNAFRYVAVAGWVPGLPTDRDPRGGEHRSCGQRAELVHDRLGNATLEAVRLVGRALMSGTTMFGGALEALLSRSMHRLLSCSFDESYLILEARYVGRLLVLPNYRPARPKSPIRKTACGRLAGFLPAECRPRIQCVAQRYASFGFGFHN
jgi:hypothetical protein